METIFSKIIRREISAEIVYETEQVLAFLDSSPNNPGHTLVIPKEPSTNVTDITPQSWAYVMEAVRFLAPKIQMAVGAQAMNVMMNSGKAAGQVVFHTHIHLIPRFEGDGYIHWPGHPYTEGELPRIAALIRQTLD